MTAGESDPAARGAGPSAPSATRQGTHGPNADLARELDAVIDAALAQRRVVGTVVMVAHEGRVAYQRAAGFADRETGRPMRVDTVFRLASLTKPIVSAVAMALVHQGVMALDEPVTRWLPDFRPKLPDGREPAITVQQLLTHTAGLGYGFFEEADGPYRRLGISDGLDQPGLGMDENLQRLARAPLRQAPGEAWHYSVATDVLGAAMAQAAGLSLPRLVARHVTAPLGLHDMGFHAAPGADLATPYADDTPQPRRMGEVERVDFGLGAGIVFAPSRAFDRASFPSGGAGMLGSAPSMLRVLEALRRDGGGLVPSERARALRRNQIGDLSVDAQGPGWGFGYGGAVLKDPVRARSPQSPGTWQWGGVYGHTWFVDAERELTVVLLTNTAIEGMVGRYPVALRDAVYRGVGAPRSG